MKPAPASRPITCCHCTNYMELNTCFPLKCEGITPLIMQWAHPRNAVFSCRQPARRSMGLHSRSCRCKYYRREIYTSERFFSLTRRASKLRELLTRQRFYWPRVCGSAAISTPAVSGHYLQNSDFSCIRTCNPDPWRKNKQKKE